MGRLKLQTGFALQQVHGALGETRLQLKSVHINCCCVGNGTSDYTGRFRTQSDAWLADVNACHASCSEISGQRCRFCSMLVHQAVKIVAELLAVVVHVGSLLPVVSRILLRAERLHRVCRGRPCPVVAAPSVECMRVTFSGRVPTEEDASSWMDVWMYMVREPNASAVRGTAQT